MTKLRITAGCLFALLVAACAAEGAPPPAGEPDDGIMGEYVGRLYDEAKGRPLYVVRHAPERPGTDD